MFESILDDHTRSNLEVENQFELQNTNIKPVNLAASCKLRENSELRMAKTDGIPTKDDIEPGHPVWASLVVVASSMSRTRPFWVTIKDRAG